MEISFVDKSFRDLCVNEHLARRAFGSAVAEKLKARLADLSAASVVAELFTLPGKTRPREDKQSHEMVMDLVDGQLLYFKSGHLKPRLHKSGETDWYRIRRVKLLGVSETHA